MIDVSELCLGNLVNYNGNPSKVLSIINDAQIIVVDDKCVHDVICDEKVSPIDIDEKKLLDNGFHCEENVYVRFLNIENCIVYVEKSSKSVNEWFCRVENAAHISLGGFYCRYFHELQNGAKLLSK